LSYLHLGGFDVSHGLIHNEVFGKWRLIPVSIF